MSGLLRKHNFEFSVFSVFWIFRYIARLHFEPMYVLEHFNGKHCSTCKITWVSHGSQSQPDYLRVVILKDAFKCLSVAQKCNVANLIFCKVKSWLWKNKHFIFSFLSVFALLVFIHLLIIALFLFSHSCYLQNWDLFPVPLLPPVFSAQREAVATLMATKEIEWKTWMFTLVKPYMPESQVTFGWERKQGCQEGNHISFLQRKTEWLQR